jgi:hypothetical protein
MFRRPKFLEVLLDIRQEMARDAGYDCDVFAEMVRSGNSETPPHTHKLPENGIRKTPRPRVSRK